MHTSRPPHPEVGRQALNELRVALEQALALEPPPTADWEAILQRLLESQGGGAILRQQAILQDGFRRANAVLAGFLDERPLCPPGLRPRRAAIMEAVFHKFYAGKVQPAWSRVTRAKTMMNADLQAIAAHLQPVLYEPARVYLRDYWGAESRVDAQLQAVAMRHVRLWQTALRQCDMLPAAASAQRMD